MTKYAAAPRGVKLNHVEDDDVAGAYAYWGRRLLVTEMFKTFREALDDAVEISEQDMIEPMAYEVVTFDDKYEIVDSSRLLASCGVIYEPVDDDELDTRIEEETEDYE